MLPSLSDIAYEKKDKISVVTVGFAEYDFARQVVGDSGEVTMLLSAGQESHTYEPTPSDILKIEQCDVFVCGGGMALAILALSVDGETVIENAEAIAVTYPDFIADFRKLGADFTDFRKLGADFTIAD